MEELKKFLAALQENKDLQKKVADAVKALPEGSSEEEISKCLIAVAKEAGYTVTGEDLAGLKELAAQTGDEMEMNVDEMAQAAGGGKGGGVTLTGCSVMGAGITLNITSSGFGFCFLLGGGENRHACLLYGVGSHVD